jgi:hypothetical protein
LSVCLCGTLREWGREKESSIANSWKEGKERDRERLTESIVVIIQRDRQTERDRKKERGRWCKIEREGERKRDRQTEIEKERVY